VMITTRRADAPAIWYFATSENELVLASYASVCCVD